MVKHTISHSTRRLQARLNMQVETLEKERTAQATRIKTLQTLFDDVDSNLIRERHKTSVLQEEIESQVRCHRSS